MISKGLNDAARCARVNNRQNVPARRACLAVPLITGLLVSLASAITPELPFYEDFEPPWDRVGEWLSCETSWSDCPTDDPIVVPGHPSYGWGPVKFETWPDEPNGGKVYSGERSGRQPIWDPYYGAIRHPFTPPDSGDLRIKVQQYDFADILCDCDPYGPPSRPNFDVNGWIILTNPYRTEYFVLGVNSHQSWTHVSWATAVDGWNTSPVERVSGWRRMEIIVHPYTGGADDVEFLIDGQVIAQGHRQPGGGAGIDVNWLTLGGDPILIAESTLTNTFEEFWYDEVLLTGPCPNPDLRFDADNDGDVDQSDFGALQTCVTGENDPGDVYDAPNCYCMDTDDDDDVDQADYDAFALCASGPGIAADAACDDATWP